MEKIDKAIEILQAFKEGKTVEWSSYILHSGEWSDWNEFEFNGRNINLINSQYCIKKQPTYRPYANAEEFLNASKEHGPYIKSNAAIYDRPLTVSSKGISLINYSGILNKCSEGLEANFYNYEQVNKHFKWQDGTPCGILEQ